jgi:hypothetical protein
VTRAWLAVGTAGLVAGLATACAGNAPARAPEPTFPPLHLAPVSDLAPAAGLRWLLAARPRELATRPDLAPALALLFPDPQVRAFAARHGGVSPLDLEELGVASYASTTLFVTRGAIDPSRVESAFRKQADAIEGRAIDRAAGPHSITRMWGTLHGERAQLALLGHDGVGLEVGRFGQLRASELFAEQRLKKASPALRAVPLVRADELLRSAAGDAPLRAFAPGPFEDEAARALAGLLGASTAAAVAVRVVPKADVSDHTAALELTVVLTGAWKDDAPAAAQKLRAAVDTLGATAIGRLTSLDHPLVEPRIEPLPDALRLTLVLDALSVARGLHASFGQAEISEIMSY